MLTVDHFAEIRRARRDGLTIRQITLKYGHSPKTVLKALKNAEPLPYTRARPGPRVFGPFQAILDAMLKADESAPPKQRHTAMQIYRRLAIEHSYPGSYDQVRRYLQTRRLSERETFVPLDHPPGHRCEADFGHIHVDFPEGRRQVPVLIVTWSYSNAPFAIALPTERTEAVLHGLCEAFAFFGCVPKELWWDNPKTVAIHIGKGRERTLHSRYAALASHYLFTPKFCMPVTPQEKSRVENRVKDLERIWATPVPQVKDLAELNAYLRHCSVTSRQRTCGTNAETVETRFHEDRAKALPLPNRAFEACVIDTGLVDKYQTVACDRHRYSVPRRHAFQIITIKAYVDRIDIVANHQVVASHPRCYATVRERVLNPLHFLGVLTTKPATLDHAPVFRDWNLPPGFTTLRERLQVQFGTVPGDRQYIGIVELLNRYPVIEVERAIVDGLSREDIALSSIRRTLELSTSSDTALTFADVRLTHVRVPRPDLTRFNQLLSPHGDDHERIAVIEDQSETVETPHDAGGARETGP